MERRRAVLLVVAQLAGAVALTLALRPVAVWMSRTLRGWLGW